MPFVCKAVYRSLRRRAVRRFQCGAERFFIYPDVCHGGLLYAADAVCLCAAFAVAPPCRAPCGAFGACAVLRRHDALLLRCGSGVFLALVCDLAAAAEKLCAAFCISRRLHGGGTDFFDGVSGGAASCVRRISRCRAGACGAACRARKKLFAAHLFRAGRALAFGGACGMRRSRAFLPAQGGARRRGGGGKAVSAAAVFRGGRRLCVAFAACAVF